MTAAFRLDLTHICLVNPSKDLLLTKKLMQVINAMHLPIHPSSTADPDRVTGEAA